MIFLEIFFSELIYNIILPYTKFPNKFLLLSPALQI